MSRCRLGQLGTRVGVGVNEGVGVTVAVAVCVGGGVEVATSTMSASGVRVTHAPKMSIALSNKINREWGISDCNTRSDMQ